MYNNNNINKASSGGGTAVMARGGDSDSDDSSVEIVDTACGGTSARGTSAHGTTSRGGRSISARAKSGGTAVTARGGGGDSDDSCVEIVDTARGGTSARGTTGHDGRSISARAKSGGTAVTARGGGGDSDDSCVEIVDTARGGTSARGTTGGRSISARAKSGGTAVAARGGGFKSMASTLQDGYAPHNPFPYSPLARQAKNRKSSPIHRSARKILPSSSTHSRGTRRSTQALPLSSSSSGARMGGRAPSNSSALELNNGLPEDQALALALKNSASAPTSTLNHHPAPKENRGRAPSNSSALEINNGLPEDQALALALKNSASAPTSTLNHHPAPKENRSPQSKPAKSSKPVKRQSNQTQQDVEMIEIGEEEDERKPAAKRRRNSPLVDDDDVDIVGTKTNVPTATNAYLLEQIACGDGGGDVAPRSIFEPRSESRIQVDEEDEDNNIKLDSLEEDLANQLLPNSEHDDDMCDVVEQELDKLFTVEEEEEESELPISYYYDILRCIMPY
eukprot:scaffold15704_cov165-Skeletonema_dohrnii-CCMP3373.AAC.1